MSSEIRNLQELQENIGYTFSNEKLLKIALRHTSFVKGDKSAKDAEHNQRMEFLGDAVLELCVSDYIYRAYPDFNEGAMTRLRALVVCEAALHRAAKQYELQKYLQLGRGEESTGGREKPSILSDAFEAVIGAVFLDGGMEAACCFIRKFAIPAIEEVAAQVETKDYKTMLQEYVQKNHWGVVRYELIGSSGPDHKKTFEIRVLLDDKVLGNGMGGSKHSAGQMAAKQALLQYGVIQEKA